MLDMKALDDIFDKLEGKGNGNTVKFREGDTKTLRIVPDPDGQPFRVVYLHYNIGGQSFLCPQKNFGETSAILEFAFKMYGEAKANDDKAGMDAAKQLFPKTRGISPVIVRGEEEKGVQFWIYNLSILRGFREKVQHPQYGDITDPTQGGTGRDFEVEFKKSDARALYPQPFVTWLDRGTVLVDNDELYAELTSVDEFDYYGNFRRIPGTETQAILERHLNPSKTVEVAKYGDGGATKSIEDAVAELEGE